MSAPSADANVLSMGPFLGLNTTKGAFYLGPEAGAVASNVDISTSPGDFVTAKGRELIGNVTLPTGFTIVSVTPFASYVGSMQSDGTIAEVSYLVWSAANSTNGKGIAGWLDPVTGTSGQIGTLQPFTQAVQFGDSLYTNSGYKIIFDPNGRLTFDDWQVQVPTGLSYEVTGSQAIQSISGIQGTYQYAYTVRRSAHWRTEGGPKGVMARCIGSVYVNAPGQVTMSLEAPGGATYTTQPVSFTYSKYLGNELASEQVAAQLAQTINSDPQIGQLVTAYPNFTQHGSVKDRYIAVYVNKAGSAGNGYNMWLTISDQGNKNSALPVMGTPGTKFKFGSDSSKALETTLNPNIATYQESSPVLTPQFTVANDGNHVPCFVPPTHVRLNDLISGITDGGETYYGVLYRSSLTQPTFVMVDYLINLATGTTDDGNSNICFLDPNTDTQIENNVILTLHNDVPPMIGQEYPGPLLSNLNTENAAPPTYFEQKGLKTSFPYNNPAVIAQHQTRMFALTMYPTMPVQFQMNSVWRNRIQLQPQLWYSDYGVPWAYDDVAQLLLVGSEVAAGNYQIDSNNGAPWSPQSQLTDFPVSMASTGSLLVLFKRRSGWILFGDSPAEFQQGLRFAFDIGAACQSATAPGEGGIFWVADKPLGFYFFNGNAPSYISEDIRSSLQALKSAGELALCAGRYSSGHIYYASFPPSANTASPAYGTGITFCYSSTEQKWFTLPYGSNVLFDSPINQGHAGIVTQTPATNQWQFSYLRSSVQDLSTDVTGTWQTGVIVGSRRGVRKIFKNIVLLAPQQAADATVTLYVDGALAETASWNLDMEYVESEQENAGPWARTATCSATGYSAYAILTVTNRSTTEPATIYGVDINYEEKGALQSTASFDGSFTNVSP